MTTINYKENSSMYRSLFTKTIVARDKDGEPRGYEYKAIEVAKDINIAVYRERDGEISELHLLDEDGNWSGPSVTIYGPEIEYSFRSERDGGPAFLIRPAYCSASSAQTETTAHTRAQARMLMLAADIADDLTQRKTPELLAEIAERQERHEQRKREREVELAAEDAKAAKLDAATNGDVTARITLVDRKSKLTGSLTRAESGRNYFELIDNDMKIHRFGIAAVEGAESRQLGASRFGEVPLS